MKRLIIRMAERLLLCVAVVFAYAPCGGKVYDPEVPEELKNYN